jgi:hypothetical protein
MKTAPILQMHQQERSLSLIRDAGIVRPFNIYVRWRTPLQDPIEFLRLPAAD